MFSFADRDCCEGGKSSSGRKFFYLNGWQQKWQVETREKIFDVEKRVEGGNPVLGDFENNDGPAFMAAFRIRAILAERR